MSSTSDHRYAGKRTLCRAPQKVSCNARCLCLLAPTERKVYVYIYIYISIYLSISLSLSLYIYIYIFGTEVRDGALARAPGAVLPE